jgi:acetyl esterase/lipase
MISIDPELAALLADIPLVTALDAESLTQIRPYSSGPLEPLLENRAVDRREVTVPAQDGTEIPLTILSPKNLTAPAPCIYWLHGGGMVMGDRFAQLDIPLQWLDRFGAVVVTVDYRLAPEFTGTTLADDCYTALHWTATNAAELGIDPARIVVAGTSAGGGLAAGVTLMSRDRGTPSIAAQVLICPMLDHRNTTVSSHQFAGTPGVWTRETNEFAWRSLLPDTTDVSEYTSPSLATDLSALPPTYIDAGTAEVFRDEDVAYATAIWASGGQAELHVWAGGFHGFDALFPHAKVSAAARRTRTDWLARLLESTATS